MGTRTRAGIAVSEGRDAGNPRQTSPRSSARVSGVFPVSSCPAGGGDVPSAPRFRGIRPRSGNIGFSQRGESGRPSARAIRLARRSRPLVRLRLIAPDHRRSSPLAISHPPRHRHPPSVALTFDRPFDGARLEARLEELLQTHGQNILRTKGIFDIAGEARKWVFQSVHMLLEGDYRQPWQDGEARRSRMVLIGRDLEAMELRAGFEACIHRT